MRTLTKLAIGGLMLAGTATATTAPASAGVDIGLNVGAPGVTVAYYGNPCFRPYLYRPAYCGYPAYGRPIFVDGGWYRGPVYYRNFGGERYFWLHDRWTGDRDDFHRDRDNFYRFRGHDRDGFHDRDSR